MTFSLSTYTFHMAIRNKIMISFYFPRLLLSKNKKMCSWLVREQLNKNFKK
jgi:hypothetical protein